MSTMQSLKGKEVYVFGPFRVDADKEILLRESEPVSLTPKAFQVLLALIRRSPEVVTKDDLMRTVWAETFVEEANLSRNIFMVRKALGESPEEHRYIVTVPGRGYRFAEKVRVAEAEPTVLVASHSEIKIQVSEGLTRVWTLLAGAAVVAVSSVATFWVLSHRTRPLTARDTVVLADFANFTGDPLFDGTLRQGMAVQLEQSPYLSLVSEARIRRTLPLMGQQMDARLTADISHQVCERLGSTAVIEGSIARLGEKYVLSLHAANCHNGETLDDEQVQVASKNDILNALSQMATRFRKRMGESLSAIQSHDKPLAEATTASLEALKAYSTAWQIHLRSGPVGAVPLFRRAIELDPQFAMAYAALGRLYADLDQSQLAAENTEAAWRLRDRTSDRERFFITASYQALTIGNQEQARQTCEAWAEAYPRDAFPHTFLAGFINKVAGRYETGIEEARKAIELDPDFAIAYYALAVDEAYLNRFDEAATTLRTAENRGLAIDEFSMLEFDLAFLKGDSAGMQRVSARARQRPEAEGWVTNKEAYAVAYAGHLQQARSLTKRALEDSNHVAQPERAGLWQAGAAVREALFGNSLEARTRALSALSLSKGREVEYGAALALVLSGELARGDELASELEKRFPDDTFVRFSYLPALRAASALARHNPNEAVDQLQTAIPYELGPSHQLLGGLYPVYLRGLAYLEQRNGAQAAQEFEKILDHQGIVISDPIGALAYLQIARAYTVTGDMGRARSAYRDFLNIWSTADRDIPLVSEAKREYSRLPN